MKYLNALMFLLLAHDVPAYAAQPLHTEEVIYQGGDTELKGFLVYDPAIEDPRPGVLVMHEWWGLNEYARSRARQLAKAGYVAFAVDMHGGGQATENPKRAGKLASFVEENPALARARFIAALNVLRDQDVTNPAADRYAKLGLDIGYDVQADKQSWGDMNDFFKWLFSN